MARVDLHTHSNASDGSLPPAALVAAAREAGLAAIALTDHDTVDGLEEAQEAGAADGVEVVAGVELSVGIRGADVHLLGYLFDPASPSLRRLLEEGRASRDERNPRILARLRAAGVPVTMDDVAAEAGRSTGLGRPHIASALVRLGAVASVKEAFDRYLAEGRPAFVPRSRLDPRRAIRALHEAGGLAVLAHPVTIPAPYRDAAVLDLADAGLDGVEVVHPKQDAAVRARLGDLAASRGLATTGGSDFHGAAKPDVALGTGVAGNVHVDADVLARLRARLRR